ncbi:hypothetical protein [Undibacterium sp.]|uniref:hypothetical protein n=1 Tax=Undibacterium sp. TaxID=1914977 RepID=UPI002731D98B|nr:hypothetical protein [Undibacterium sp.]MDP1976278.1 hypothetical protein [Undibacterium sp.]
MNTTSNTLNLPERDRQPIIKMMTMLYPSELYALKDYLDTASKELDSSKPGYEEIWGGLCMLKHSIKHAIIDIEAAASSKAGA